MTLVEMELNIAKLKLQKQEQDLAKAQKRLVSLQNGGPVEDDTDGTDDAGLDSVGNKTGSDDEMSSSDAGSDGNGDDSMQSITGSAASCGRWKLSGIRISSAASQCFYGSVIRHSCTGSGNCAVRRNRNYR